MFRPKWINAGLLLVAVNRQAQKEKREKLGSLIIAETQKYMQYNLQLGTVVMIGKKLKEFFPLTQEGDQVFFHHSVEGSLMNYGEEGSEKISPTDENVLWDADPDWRYYTMSQDLVYGFISARTGEVLMHPEKTLALPLASESDDRKLVKKGKLYLFKNYMQTREAVEEKLATLKRECETHAPSPTDPPERYALKEKRVKDLMREMDILTRWLNTKRAVGFSPAFVHPDVKRDFGIDLNGDWEVYYEIIGGNKVEAKVTSIQIKGMNFYILYNKYILFARKKDELTSLPAEQEAVALPSV